MKTHTSSKPIQTQSHLASLGKIKRGILGPDVRIPHSSPCWRVLGFSHIPFNDDRTSSWADSGKDHVCDLRYSLRSLLAHLEYHSRVQLVLEGRAFTCKHRPRFTNETCPDRNSQGGCDYIEACVQEYDFVGCILTITL